MCQSSLACLATGGGKTGWAEFHLLGERNNAQWWLSQRAILLYHVSHFSCHAISRESHAPPSLENRSWLSCWPEAGNPGKLSPPRLCVWHLIRISIRSLETRDGTSKVITHFEVFRQPWFGWFKLVDVGSCARSRDEIIRSPESGPERHFPVSARSTSRALYTSGVPQLF